MNAVKAEKFAALRAQIHAQYHQREAFLCSAVTQGVPRGAITAIAGVGKTELAVRLIAENPTFRVAWIEEHLSIFPLALLQRGVGLSRVLFIDAGPDLAWSALQVLKAQIFPVVVIYAADLDLNTLRRVQLAAETANSACIWLADEPKNLWPISLQLQSIRVDGELAITTLKSA